MTGYEKIEQFAQHWGLVGAETIGTMRVFKFKEGQEALSFKNYLEHNHHIRSTASIFKRSVSVTNVEASKIGDK